jgi:hypothetical protein
MQRRRFLKLSLFSSLGLGLGLFGIGATLALTDRLGGRQALPPQLPAALIAELRLFSPAQATTFIAAGLRILDGTLVEVAPPGRPLLALAAVGLDAHCRFADHYVSQLDPPLQRDVGQLLALLEYWPILGGYRHRFSRLPAAEQDRVLAAWESSRWALLRQALAGLKALCMLAHYQDPRSFAAIGYSGPLLGQPS